MRNSKNLIMILIIYTSIFAASMIIKAAQDEFSVFPEKPEQPPYKGASREFSMRIIDSKLVEYRKEGSYIIETYTQVVEMRKPILNDLIENSKD